MKFKFNQKITCNDGGVCSNRLFEKLTDLLETNDKSMFHLSIHHDKNNHQIFVFLYDKDNVNETERQGKNIFNKNPNQPCKKFTKRIPTLTELKNALK